jgi:hypothetical protein
VPGTFEPAAAGGCLADSTDAAKQRSNAHKATVRTCGHILRIHETAHASHCRAWGFIEAKWTYN